MKTTFLTQTLMDLSNAAVSLGSILLVQSSLLIVAGLVAAYLCRKQGAALQSLILRATLAAVLVCPLVSYVLGLAGIEGSRFQLPRVTSHDATALLSQEGVAQRTTARTDLPPSPGVALDTSVQLGTPGANESGAGEPGAPAPAHAQATPPRIDGWRFSAWVESLQSLSGLSLLYCALTLGWFSGALVLLVPLLICHVRIGRLRWQAGMADVEIFERCQAIAREIKVTSPEVLTHREVNSPLLVGLFRPAILLPEPPVAGTRSGASVTSSELTAREIRDAVESVPTEMIASREVLIHELAHLARGDCLWHLLGRIATALLFFQPLLWALVRRIEETAEEVCDNYVIEHAPDRRAYARQLVDLAERLQFPRAESAVGVGVIAFKSALGQRIVRLLDESRNAAMKTGVQSKMATVFAGVLITTATGIFGVGTRATITAQGRNVELQPGQSSGAGIERGDQATKTSSDTNRAVLNPRTTTGEVAVSKEAPSSGLSMRILPVPAEPENLSSGLFYNDLTLLPDGRLLTTGGRFNSRVLRLAANTLRLGSNSVVTDKSLYSPKFTADGKKMVSVTYEGPNAARGRIILVDVDDLEPRGEARQLYQNDAANYLKVTDWSADGQTVLCIFRLKGDWHMTAVSVRDGTARDVKESFRADSFSRMNFSPDGRWIAYDQYEGPEANARDLYLISSDGATEVPLVRHPADEYLLGWTPSGDRILFASNRRRTWDAYVIGIREGKPVGEPQFLKESIGRVKPLGFTSEGAFLYRVTTNVKDVHVVPLDPVSGKISGKATKIPYSFEGRTGESDWSRDGRFLVCEVMDAGPGSSASSDTICIRNMLDGTERELKCEGGPVSRPVWSPTGAFLIAWQGSGLHRIDALTGKSLSLTTPSRLRNGDPAGWDADGKAFYYPANRAIVRYEIETGAETKFPLASDALDPADQKFSFAKLSPDAQQVAYLRGNFATQRIYTATLNDGQSRMLADISGPRYGNVYFLVWSPDSRYIMFRGSRRMSGEPWFTTFWRVSAATGEVEDLGKVEGQSDFNFCISPDGQQVAFAVGESKRNIWVLENFLPEQKAATQ